MVKVSTKREADGGKKRFAFVASLEKGISVLRAFAGVDGPMRLIDIVAATNLERSAAQRLVYTLEEMGLLIQDQRTKLYALSPRVLEFCFAYLRNDRLASAALPYLLEANKACEEAVTLVEPYDTEVYYVTRVPSRHPIAMDVVPGAWFPAWCIAAGRAILAFLPEGQARDIVERSKLVRYTPNTLAGKAQVMEALKKTRQDGFATSKEEYGYGDISIAAPVFDAADNVIAAVSISGPTDRWALAQATRELAPLAKAAAGRISESLRGASALAQPGRFIPPRR